MNRKVFSVILGVILILSLGFTVSSQSNIVNVNLDAGQVAAIDCSGTDISVDRNSTTNVDVYCNSRVKNTPTPTATSRSRSTPTNTSTPVDTPTPTSEPINTATPTPTSEPVGNVEPYPNAPLCTEHDNHTYHGLWNYEEGCHYDHGHGVNPANTVFADKELAYQVGGVWNTPGENENPPDGKHKGFHNIVVSNPTSGVRQVLVQIHDLASNRALKARFHTSTVHVMYTDGSYLYAPTVLDFGLMHQQYKEVWQQTIFDEPGVTFHENPPYRASNFSDNGPRGGRNIHTWNFQKPQPIIADMYPNPYGFLVYSLDFQTGDAWSKTPLGDDCYLSDCYPTEYFIGGKINGSLHRLYNLGVNVPDVSEGLHFTNRRGQIDTNCTEASFDCLPIILEGNPVDFSFDNGAGLSTWEFSDPANEWVDNDICFIGEQVAPCYDSNSVTSGWITYQ